MCKGNKKCKKCAINMAKTKTKRRRRAAVRGLNDSKGGQILGSVLAIAAGRIGGDLLNKVSQKVVVNEWVGIGAETVLGGGVAYAAQDPLLSLVGASMAANGVQKTVAKITPSIKGLDDPFRPKSIGNPYTRPAVPKTEFEVY